MMRYFSILMLSLGIIGIVYLLLTYSPFSRSIEAFAAPPLKLFIVVPPAVICEPGASSVFVEESCPEGSVYISHQCSTNPATDATAAQNLESNLVTESVNAFDPNPTPRMPIAQCVHSDGVLGSLCDPPVTLTMTLVCAG